MQNLADDCYGYDRLGDSALAQVLLEFGERNLLDAILLDVLLDLRDDFTHLSLLLLLEALLPPFQLLLLAIQVDLSINCEQELPPGFVDDARGDAHLLGYLARFEIGFEV